MPDYPQAVVDATAQAIGNAMITRQSAEAIARAALDAAAPLLAESVAEKILAHMEGFGPKRPAGALEPVIYVGRDYRTWRRHFGIAARIAAGAFTTREESLRMAAEAIARGDFAACPAPEGEQ